MLPDAVLSSMRATLFAGQYNLLLGSGVSLDSTDAKHRPLKGTRALTEELCTLKGVHPGTSLARVCNLLDPQETLQYITQPFSGCRPGETVSRLTSYIWKTAFTFNVDDCLEAAYESVSRAKQVPQSFNFDALYTVPANKSELPIVHLHGFAREPEKGYVFSTNDYARVTRGNNAWMHVLSELMGSEPFIIAGTSLNESDLDFYLSGRTRSSARADRGPAIFVEPNPDKVTEKICELHGLILVPETLADFLSWVQSRVGPAPTVTEITVPTIEGLFGAGVSADAKVEFFTSFELVRPVAKNAEGEVSPFYFGRAPRWSDLASSLDVPTDDERAIAARAHNAVDSSESSPKILGLTGPAASGKSTILRRAAYTLASEGIFVFHLQLNKGFNADNVRSVLKEARKPAVLIVDNLADQATSVRELVLGFKPKYPVAIVGSDRDYRFDHIYRVLGDQELDHATVTEWSVEGFELLLEKLRTAGLLGDSDAVHSPKKFAPRLRGDPVAIATCRALNNFKPLDTIIKSLWKDSQSPAKRSYALAALGQHCHPGGVHRTILLKAYPNDGLNDQLIHDCPLPLAYADDEYVVPYHAVVADRLLIMLSRELPDLLLELFNLLAEALSPYVNRRTAIQRTPEALLASRLFNSERVTRQLLGNRAEQFYVAARDAWQWNSRYWEQRALFAQTTSIDTAIQHARHAVAIEAHPFPWTTLASLLGKKMEGMSAGTEAIFNEICDLLSQVLKLEAERAWRPTPHPYAVIFHAANVFVDRGGTIGPKRRSWIRDLVGYCERTFPRDTTLLNSGKRLKDKT